MPMLLAEWLVGTRPIQRMSPFRVMTWPSICSLMSTFWSRGGRFMEIWMPLSDMSTMIAGLSSRLERTRFFTRISFLFSMATSPLPAAGNRLPPL